MFSKLEGLDSLARRDGVDIRPTLVRVLTDLYVQKPAHTAEEERHYTELVLRLIDSVDVGTRITVAGKLGAYASAPPAVIRRLARDVIEVAEPVLRRTQVLTAPELNSVIRDFGANHAAAIAAREPAAPDRVSPAADDPQAAVTEPSRGDQPADTLEIELAELFFSSDPQERRILLMSLGSVESETPQRVRPEETIRALEAAALGRDRAGFTTLLENALGLTHEQAARIVTDASGEPLLIAAKAIAMPSVVLQRVLMFIDPAIGESVARVFELASLYERVSADAAHKIIASLRGREPARVRRPAHRPMYYDDEATRGRRGSAIRRPSAATERQAPARTETGIRQRTI
jgi:uncharacterized protein (DUF2336 family)